MNPNPAFMQRFTCPAAHSGGRDRAAGLTLIEMLIVLVIIGIATSAAMFSAAVVGRDRRTGDEAVRLAAHLQMAVDETLVSRLPMALFWTARGYQAQRWTGTGWQPATTPMLARPHDLPADLELRRQDGTPQPVTLAADGLGPAVNLEIAGPGGVWVVAFDGFSASATGANP